MTKPKISQTALAVKQEELQPQPPLDLGPLFNPTFFPLLKRYLTFEIWLREAEGNREAVRQVSQGKQCLLELHRRFAA